MFRPFSFHNLHFQGAFGYKGGMPNDAQTERRIYRQFMQATQSLQADFRDYRSIFCLDEAPDGHALNGQTAFFRHHRVMRSLLESIKKPKRLRMLAAPASIGCEAYSLARLSLDMGIDDCRIDAFDVSSTFTQLARVGAYPRDMLLRVGSDKDDIFASAPKDSLMVPVQDALKSRVRFLDAQAFEDFKPQERYDIVLIGNLFQHLHSSAQIQACVNVAKETGADFVVFTKPGTPKADGQHFVDIRAVHPTWRLDRVFDEYKTHLSHYNIWARKAAFMKGKHYGA